MSVKNMTGSCLCGAVRYTAEDVEEEVSSCHCGQCRRWGGSSAIAVEVGSVAFNGEEHIRCYDSSDWAERGFCVNCGSSLFYHLKGTERYVMWLGSFDDQAPFKLVEEIYIEDKPPSYDFAGDHKRLTGAEFLAREL